MNILGITLARGGSKSVHKKNIRPILDKPLIAYTIEEAKKSKLISEYIVSTDDKEILRIHSDAGVLEAKKEDKNISVNMGYITMDWNKIPLSENMDTMNIPIIIEGYTKGVAVNVGNPHIVFFGNSINQTNLNEVGPSIEKHEYFPNKTNVELVEVIDSHTLKMRVWERGVGVTLACGSGACASVYAAWKKNLTKNNVEVILEKGSLFINILDDKAIMTGPAEISYHGNLEI